MKITIKEGDNLPVGEYELTNPQKLENAKGNLSFGVSGRMVLLEYDRIAGRVVKDGVALPAQSLWKKEQEHMNKPIEQFTDEELLVVIRRLENPNIPGSLYQRANNEWQIRHQQRLLAKTGQNSSGIHFEVGGDMTNHGLIQTSPNATVGIAVAGNYSSNHKTKIIQGESGGGQKQWYEKPIGIIFITVISGIIIASVVSYLHWN